jgi:hypothetical protein
MMIAGIREACCLVCLRDLQVIGVNAVGESWVCTDIGISLGLLIPVGLGCEEFELFSETLLTLAADSNLMGLLMGMISRGILMGMIFGCRYIGPPFSSPTDLLAVPRSSK